MEEGDAEGEGPSGRGLPPPTTSNTNTTTNNLLASVKEQVGGAAVPPVCLIVPRSGASEPDSGLWGPPSCPCRWSFSPSLCSLTISLQLCAGVALLSGCHMFPWSQFASVVIFHLVVI